MESVVKEVLDLLKTVNENRDHYTPDELDRFERIGELSVEYLKKKRENEMEINVDDVIQIMKER